MKRIPKISYSLRSFVPYRAIKIRQTTAITISSKGPGAGDVSIGAKSFVEME